MKESFLKFSGNAIFGIVVLAAASAPLFFIPTTFEFFEFNKFTLVLVLAIVGLLLWGLRMVLQKKFSFTRTPFDIPLLLLLVVYFIASFSSIDQYISFVGQIGRPWPSFFSLATLAALFFMATSNLKTKKQVDVILQVLVGSTVAASIAAVVSYFGAFIPLDFAKIRSFNTLGSPNSLAALQAIVLPITIALIAFNHRKLQRIAFTLSAAVMVVSLILINFVPAYLALTAGILILTVYSMQNKITRPAKVSLLAIVALSVGLAIVRYVPPLANVTINKLVTNADPNAPQDQRFDTPKNLALPQRVGWDISASTIGKRPLFGTGPGTFQFAYSQLRPRVTNDNKNWAVRFDKSSSDFTENITTTGIVGTIAFLLLIVATLRFAWTLLFKNKNGLIYLPLASAIIVFAVSTFLTTSSFSIALVFFVLAAAISTIAKTQDERHVSEMTIEVATLKNSLNWIPGGDKLGVLKSTSGSKNSSKSQLLPLIFLIIIAVASVFAGWFQVNAWQGEYFYRQALLSAAQNNGNKTIEFLQKAIAKNPRPDSYHRTLAQTALNAAVTLNAQKDLKDDQKNLLGQLAQVAVDQAKVSSGYQILPLKLPGISSANPSNWETLASVYQALIGSIQGSDVHATNTLAQAVALDPQNPLLHDKLGQLYQKLNNLDLAQRKFEDSIITKGDFGPGHYHLAKVLIEKKSDAARIVNELNLAKRFLPKEDPAMDEINRLTDEYNQKVQEAQSQSQNQTEDPNASPNPGASPNPSPSGSPKPSPTPIPSVSPIPSPSL